MSFLPFKEVSVLLLADWQRGGDIRGATREGKAGRRGSQDQAADHVGLAGRELRRLPRPLFENGR